MVDVVTEDAGQVMVGYLYLSTLVHSSLIFLLK
jgi:hypothetical protein